MAEEEIDRKGIEERLDRLEKENRRLKQIIKERTEPRNSQDSEDLSRRQFLKKVGAGAAGLGALATVPSVSAFNIRSSNPLQYFGDNQSNPNFRVNETGAVDSKSVNVDKGAFNNEIVGPGGRRFTRGIASGEIVDSFEDTDNSTGFNTSLDALGDYNSYKLRFSYGASGTLPELHMTLNGYTSSDYEYRTENQGSTSYSSGDTKFVIIPQYSGGWTTFGEVGLGPDRHDGGSFSVDLWANIGGRKGISRGRMIHEYEVNSVQVSSAGDAAIKVDLIGIP